ncbi:hypothetical protein DYQ86_11605 [Acidobacteria bacterium AB60]|nr:hypothetical protein DYQ86_11605 [Acidobacteria bacterium AB60]
MMRPPLLSSLARQAAIGLLAACIAAPASFAVKKKEQPPEAPRVRATLPPSFSIPAEPLGFAPPGEFYLGMRNSLVTLDFLDEDHLLFTFRVPALIHRDASTADSHDERRIRAIVLRLPSGAIESETIWTVHDHARYLYMLDHGQFLVRDRNQLLLGDATLQLKPFLRFPGNVLWVEVDPTRQFLVTGSSEPPSAQSKEGEVASPSTAAAAVDTDQKPSDDQADLVLRILRRGDAKVMLVSHIRTAVHLPLNDEGYVETLRGRGSAWDLNFRHFTGGSTILGKVESVCSPLLDFISPTEFLVTTCGPSGEPRLSAMSTSGHRLWEDPSVGPSVWPLLVSAPNGSRVARETLMATHSVNAAAPLGTEDIKGQDVQVLDAASGKVVLRAAASPVLDAGGNVAISPSSRRVAVLMEGGIQFFDLPAPPPLPQSSTAQAGR